MSVDEVVAYSLAKPGALEDYPWGDETLTVKVGGRIFALIGLTSGTVGVKCGASAEAAGQWRDRYPEDVRVMSHIGRYGWNTVQLGGSVPDDEIRELIDDSYDAVVSKLPRSKRP